jgi:ribosomal protein S4
MRDANVFAFNRAMPRMSWSPRNLYNLWRRTTPSTDKSADITFTRTSDTLFQQRWRAKAVVRAYHGDFINEKTFKRWYLPSTLPDVRPRQRALEDSNASVEAKKDLAFAMRGESVAREERRKEEEEEKGLAPVGSLMFAEVERRIDVFIFRACLAHSVYEARRLVIHGDVMLNGKKHQNANTRLAPGDMVSVNPDAIRFLKGEPFDPKRMQKDYTKPLPAIPDGPPESTPDSGASTQASPAQPTSLQGTPDPSSSQKGSKTQLTPFNLPKYAAPHLFIPAYIEPSFSTCSAIYVRHPTARPGYSEIPTPYDADGEVVRLAWEWYAKVRPRMRSVTQLMRAPEDREAIGEKKERRRF